VDSRIQQIGQWLATNIGADSCKASAERDIITLNIGRREYTLRFDPAFLSEHSDAEVFSKLREWDVPGELCRGEGLHFIVSEAGLRLASSN
jgi:hypothetical protein